MLGNKSPFFIKKNAIMFGMWGGSRFTSWATFKTANLKSKNCLNQLTGTSYIHVVFISYSRLSVFRPTFLFDTPFDSIFISKLKKGSRLLFSLHICIYTYVGIVSFFYKHLSFSYITLSLFRRGLLGKQGRTIMYMRMYN